jgi:hypothetical protein
VLQRAGDSATVGFQHCYKEVAAVLPATGGGAASHGRRATNEDMCGACTCYRRHAPGGTRPCYRRRPQMPPSAATDAAIRGGRCSRQRRPVLPSAPTDAAIDGGRCCHTRRPLLPSATVDATRATADATTRESSPATTTVLGSAMRGSGAACFKEGRGCYEPKSP